MHAVVGGTPAYRREYVRDDAPAGPADFDRWIERTVLDPACPLFKEARYLLAEEPDLRDTSLYHSVLAAVAEGHTTRGGIANYIGRKDDTLRYPLTVLEDAGRLTRDEDALRQNRGTYRIAEPLVAFCHVVMGPELGPPRTPWPGTPGLVRRQGTLPQRDPRPALRGDLQDVGPATSQPPPSATRPRE